ncbi:putative nad dependent epimerase/dehydratase [Schistosoma mansoni]|nr:putative nad dependent epimerase/dehydratase [Schistosoma mansoni]|eukprot:XP_018652420.1 putative nad dependent epimerase/dehydratase [Schistosoma mansoni]
MFHWVNINFY